MVFRVEGMRRVRLLLGVFSQVFVRRVFEQRVRLESVHAISHLDVIRKGKRASTIAVNKHSEKSCFMFLKKAKKKVNAYDIGSLVDGLIDRNSTLIHYFNRAGAIVSIKANRQFLIQKLNIRKCPLFCVV